jgi:hypothetical protein
LKLEEAGMELHVGPTTRAVGVITLFAIISGILTAVLLVALGATITVINVLISDVNIVVAVVFSFVSGDFNSLEVVFTSFLS